MSHNSDSGHSKNVSNFELLVTFCSGQGASYNPSKDSLTLTKLKDLLTQAMNAVKQSHDFKSSFNDCTNARATAHRDFKTFAAQIAGALAASGASDLLMADIKAILRKIKGRRATPKPIASAETTTEGNEPSPKTISASQLSYDNMIEHFSKILSLLSRQANYNPNEAELQLSALEARLSHMRSLNTEVAVAHTNWTTARFKRNNTLYDPLNGLVETALNVKEYMKSVYGVSSPEYKRVKAIEFKSLDHR